jgi:hypothetical protein
MPPTPPTVKSTGTTNTTITTPRKNGETRHTIFSREPVSIPIEHIAAVTSAHPLESDRLELYDQTTNGVQLKKGSVSTRDRRHRSRTLEAHQFQAVDNQIYGCPSSSSASSTTTMTATTPTKVKQGIQHRSESHKHRSQRLSLRRSSEDHQDKQLQIRRSNDYYSGSTQNILSETWFDIPPEHWSNLLENGWRPTLDTPGVKLVAISDSGKTKSIDLYF